MYWSASSLPPFSSVLVALNRSSRSLLFHAFQTFGLVPRMSATVSRYSATRRRSVPTISAKRRTTSGSDRSCFCATADMVRWFSTRNVTRFVSAADTPGVDHAELRMVAAATLGDVVEDRRDVQQPVALKAGDQAAAQRILVRELEHGEAAQVAHDLHDVLIDRVHVEQVVLHLADDLPERWQIPAEDSVLVHAPQL